jgi:hypothetical protein
VFIEPAPQPPPAEVIVEKTELPPLTPVPEPEVPAAPPAPTVAVYAVPEVKDKAVPPIDVR